MDDAAGPSADDIIMRTSPAGINAFTLATHSHRMVVPWKRSRFRWPITLSAALMGLNVTLMVCWIVLFIRLDEPGALTIGVIAFALILIGLSFWLMLSIKEIQLNHRQANFVDSVTHELKSPIAALQLYLETLRMRSLDQRKRDEFHAIMEGELHRLDQLINQLLEVGRLDNVGEQEAPEDIPLPALVEECIHATTTRYKCNSDVFRMHAQPVVVRSQRIVLQMIFSNLIDNSIKYAGDPPRVIVDIAPSTSGKVRTRIINNGPGVPPEDRKRIFHIFYRGGTELERRHKGTGLGLYIVHTLVRKLRGRISVHDRYDGEQGSEFVVDLPGWAVDQPGTGPAAGVPAGAGERRREKVP